MGPGPPKSALAAVAIGWCAGPLWTAQNALCLSYPTAETKGRYFSVFWIVFNLGGVVGGCISFASNFSSSASTASGSTFILFIVLMNAPYEYHPFGVAMRTSGHFISIFGLDVLASYTELLKSLFG